MDIYSADCLGGEKKNTCWGTCFIELVFSLIMSRGPSEWGSLQVVLESLLIRGSGAGRIHWYWIGNIVCVSWWLTFSLSTGSLWAPPLVASCFSRFAFLTHKVERAAEQRGRTLNYDKRQKCKRHSATVFEEIMIIIFGMHFFGCLFLVVCGVLEPTSSLPVSVPVRTVL